MESFGSCQCNQPHDWTRDRSCYFQKIFIFRGDTIIPRSKNVAKCSSGSFGSFLFVCLFLITQCKISCPCGGVKKHWRSTEMSPLHWLASNLCTEVLTLGCHKKCICLSGHLPAVPMGQKRTSVWFVCATLPLLSHHSAPNPQLKFQRSTWLKVGRHKRHASEHW